MILTYDDGTKIEFEGFEPLPHHAHRIYFPPASNKAGGHQVHGRLFLAPTDWDIRMKSNNGRITDAEMAQIRVGIVVNTTTHPFPKGLYMPYKIGRWGEITPALDGLYGDHLFNENLREKTPAVEAVEA